MTSDVFHDSAPVTVIPARKLGDVNIVAGKLSCSTRHTYRLADAGKMPAKLHLGGLVRWDLEEIDRWIADGCPSVRQLKRSAR